MSLQGNKKICILGAGAFGTSLAISYASSIRNFDVSLISGFDDHAKSMRSSKKNEFLPGFVIPEKIKVFSISEVENLLCDYILWAFPIKPSIDLFSRIKGAVNAPVIICSKGLLDDASMLSCAFEKILGGGVVGYLAGPNLAIDLANLKISAADIAVVDLDIASQFAIDLSSEFLHLTPSSDMFGVQIAGAVKNVIAIASGIADGLSLGENFHAALIARGFAEMIEIGVASSGCRETFFGLSGLGDLILTASSNSSRNTNFGRKIANGHGVLEALSEINAVCEGAQSAANIMSLAGQKGLNLPICEAVFNILYKNSSPEIIANVLG